MASATAVLWLFNFVLSFSWPPLVAAFTPAGAFGWYAAWCAALWFLGKCMSRATAHVTSDHMTVLLFFPETKELTLEELDAVFGVPTRKQMLRGFREPFFWIQKYILRQNVELPPLVDLSEVRGETKKEDEKMVGAA